MSYLFDSDDDDLFGSFRSQSLTEEQKARYRSVPVPEQKYSDLLRQQIKKNRILFRYPRPSYCEKPTDDRKRIQRIYRVQRRKDVVKDEYSPFIDYGKGSYDRSIGYYDRNTAKNFRLGTNYFREMRIRLEQNSKPEIMANWLKALKRANLPKIKTLRLDIASWEILEEYEGRFSIFKRLFPDTENLIVSFTQMHGHKYIPIQDWTSRLIRGIRKLKNLHLEFSTCNFFKDQHLFVISKALRSGLSSLECLTLKLTPRSDMNSKAIKNLWKSLDKIPNLKKLELDVGLCEDKAYYEDSFAILSHVLQRKAATLEVFKLNTGGTRIDFEAHKHLCKAFAALLPNLQRLDLRFPFRESEDDESWALLGEVLSQGSNSLKRLSLVVWDGEGIYKKQAQDFAEGVRKGRFPMMEKLEFYFKYTHNITYDGLYVIAEAISEAFSNLKDIVFLYQKDPRRFIRSENEWEIKVKAEKVVREKLKNLPKNFHLEW